MTTNIITIGFSKPRNRLFPIASYLIRLIEGTPYSHTFIKLYSEELDREIIFEAVGNGVRLVTKDNWEKHAEVVSSFELSILHCNYLTLFRYCIDKSGTDYGFLQNLGITIAKLLNLRHNIFTNGMNCSEFVARILEKEGYNFNKNINLITPKDIFDILNK